MTTPSEADINSTRPLPSLRFIREHIRAKQYRLTQHATTMRLERGILIADLEHALLNGEIIESYADALSHPSCLVLGWLETRDPLHIVCSRGEVEPALRIVTLYEPKDNLWNRDYKTRK